MVIGHRLGKLPRICEFNFNVFAMVEASEFHTQLEFANQAHHKITPNDKSERHGTIWARGYSQNLAFPFNIFAMAVSNI